jgi:beta-mannosidase
MHCWNVWHEGKSFESYYDIVPRFASEFGYQSFPSVPGVSEYAPKEQWNLTSVVMEHHQKNPQGNSIILENFARYFRFPNGFENMLYLSQVQQAFAMKMAVEYWRTQRPRCMGTLFWQLNDNWPGASCSSIEYSGTWKLLQYAAKRFYAPILPILYKKDGEIHVHVVNDSDMEIDCRISVKIRRFDGTKLSQQVFLPHVRGQSDCPVTSYSVNSLAVEPQEAYMHVKLSTKDLFIENSLFLTEPKRCVLHDPGISVEVGKTHDGFVVTLACRAPAFAVALDAGTIRGVFNDNMFDLRPTASKTVRFKTKEACPVESFAKSLTITDLYSSSK